MLIITRAMLIIVTYRKCASETVNWSCLNNNNNNNGGQQVCHIPASLRGAEQIQSYAAREHSYSLSNSGTTGCTCVSNVGWVTELLSNSLVAFRVQLLKRRALRVSHLHSSVPASSSSSLEKWAPVFLRSFTTSLCLS